MIRKVENKVCSLHFIKLCKARVPATLLFRKNGQYQRNKFHENQYRPHHVQVTANLEPVDSKKVIVRFDYFKLGGLVRFFTLMCLVVDSCMVKTG